MSVYNTEVLGRYSMYTQIFGNGFQKLIVNVNVPLRDLEYDPFVEPFGTDHLSEFIWNHMENLK